MGGAFMLFFFWASRESYFPQNKKPNPASAQPVFEASLCTMVKKAKKIAGGVKKKNKVPMPRKGDITGRYKLTSRLGKGGFGMVFEAKTIDNPNAEHLAIKFEDVSKTRRPQIMYEFRVYKSLWRLLRGVHRTRVPVVYSFLRTAGGDDRFQGIVMEKMGPNVQQIFDSYRGDVADGLREKPFTSQEVFMVADQALDCLQAVHSCGFVHRDIKPENFCVRVDDTNRLCIVDFGLSKRYLDADSKHISPRTGKSLLGTPRYTSVRCHEGHELSRRDDVESLLFMILYMTRPGLPWQKVRHKDKHKRYNIIMQKKRRSIDDGRLFAGLPAFADMFSRVQNLSFTARPDYENVRKTLKQCLTRSPDGALLSV